MKKILFALMLSLGLAQVAPVLADGEVAKKESFFKAHKKAIIIAASAITVLGLGTAAVAGDMYKNEKDAIFFSKNTFKATYTKAGLDKLVKAANFLNPFAYGTKKATVGIAILDVAIVLALIDLGNTLILKRPELAKTLYNKVKSIKSNKAVAK